MADSDNDQDLPGPEVSPIGQPDTPPPQPKWSPAPRAELVDPYPVGGKQKPTDDRMT